MHNMSTDSINVKLSGDTNLIFAAKRHPARPAQNAPKAEEYSLYIEVFIPMALEAISSSRIAVQALPIFEAYTLLIIKTEATTKISTR